MVKMINKCLFRISSEVHARSRYGVLVIKLSIFPYVHKTNIIISLIHIITSSFLKSINFIF